MILAVWVSQRVGLQQYVPNPQTAQRYETFISEVRPGKTPETQSELYSPHCLFQCVKYQIVHIVIAIVNKAMSKFKQLNDYVLSWSAGSDQLI